MFTGRSNDDPEDRLNTVRLRYDVTCDGVLVTRFCAGSTAATLDLIGAFEPTAPKMATVVETGGGLSKGSAHLPWTAPQPYGR